MAKYSIILPVRNGGEYFKLCVNSVLSQVYQDFNFIILDNNSTDGTLEWIRSNKDERIIIHTSDKDLSIGDNWSRILDVPKNEFITLIGHDDLLDPNYLSVMDDLINEYPLASLYQAHFNFIDSAGDEIRPCKKMEARQTPGQFLANILKNEIDINGTGFMMRSRDYDMVGGICCIPRYKHFLYCDFELWIKLSCISFLAVSEKECFSFRLHTSTTTRASDLAIQESLGRLILFFSELKKSDKTMSAVLYEYGVGFLLFNCQGLSHRLLRKPLKARDSLKVKDFVNATRSFADQLGVGEKYKPGKVFSIKLAIIIDSNWLFRNVFLLFKKFYSKPLLTTASKEMV